jgi:hypothetical protein
LELDVLSFYEFLVFGRVKLADVSKQILVDALVPGTRLDTGNFGAAEGLNFGLILSFSLFLIFYDFSGYIFLKSYGIMVQY